MEYLKSYSAEKVTQTKFVGITCMKIPKRMTAMTWPQTIAQMI